jgi:hypothetical protein
VRVISGAQYDIYDPSALAIDGPDLFVVNSGDITGGGSVTELNASTGALVKVISAPQFRAEPDAVVIIGADLFVSVLYGGPKFHGSVVELNASTGALLRVVSRPHYGIEYPSALAESGPDLGSPTQAREAVPPSPSSTPRPGPW